MSIYDEIKAAFDEGSFDYLEDDIHWGDDSDVVFEWGKKLASKSSREIKILYAGVGPGFILSKILSQKRYWSKIVAIDYSQNMLNLTEERLKRLAKIESENLQQTSIQNVDLLRLKEKFKLGTFDMVLCFNNTLGNVILSNRDYSLEQSFETAKRLVLSNFSYLLRKGGFLILSVYNIEKINANSEHYTKNLKIRDKISKQNFLLEYCKNGHNYNFFTHWFYKREIKNILINSGLKIKNILCRRNRIIVIAEKI